MFVTVVGERIIVMYYRRRHMSRYITLLSLTLCLAACGTMSKQGRDTTVGAGLGVAAGAAVTKSTGGAVAGGIAGGLIGHEVGKHAE